MWREKNNKLYKKFEFKGFDAAVEFIGKVAGLARDKDHHPKIINMYNVVELELSTHSAGEKVTKKDEEFAHAVDEIINTPAAHRKVHLDKAKLYTDGGSRGNPGPSALGYVILDANEKIIKKDSFYLGHTTNNQAEYQGLKTGLEEARNLGVRELEIFMDSELIVKQMMGIYKVKNRELLPLHQAVKEMLSDFSNVTFTHVPRALNKTADSMVNECLDKAEKDGI